MLAALVQCCVKCDNALDVLITTLGCASRCYGEPFGWTLSCTYGYFMQVATASWKSSIFLTIIATIKKNLQIVDILEYIYV